MKWSQCGKLAWIRSLFSFSLPCYSRSIWTDANHCKGYKPDKPLEHDYNLVFNTQMDNCIRYFPSGFGLLSFLSLSTAVMVEPRFKRRWTELGNDFHVSGSFFGGCTVISEALFFKIPLSTKHNFWRVTLQWICNISHSRCGSLENYRTQASDQWIFQVPVKGGRYYIITQLAIYTTYIPLIVIAFWEVM